MIAFLKIVYFEINMMESSLWRY